MADTSVEIHHSVTALVFRGMEALHTREPLDTFTIPLPEMSGGRSSNNPTNKANSRLRGR